MSETPTPRTDSGLVARLTQMARNKALSIGAAWNALDEAAAKIDELERELARANEEAGQRTRDGIALLEEYGRLRRELEHANEALNLRTIERDEALVAVDFANLARERKEAASKEAVALAARLRCIGRRIGIPESNRGRR